MKYRVTVWDTHNPPLHLGPYDWHLTSRFVAALHNIFDYRLYAQVVRIDNERDT